MIGQMRHRIAIKSRTSVKDDTGGDTFTNTTTTTVWAKITPVRGREGQDAGRLAAIQTYLIKIYDTTIDTSYFLTWGTKNLQIRSVEDRWQQDGDTFGQFLTLECDDGSQV
jgi:SPP1 family predicted phage head-tail adaptor